MSTTSRAAVRLMAVVGALLLLAFVLTLFFVPAEPGVGGGTVTLADGGTLTLLAVAYTNQLQYEHRKAPRMVRVLAPLIPDFIEQRISSRGSIGVGGGTNLVVVTLRTRAAQSSMRLEGIRLADDQGHVFSGGAMTGTLSLSGEMVNIWRLPAFNRRSRSFKVEFITHALDGERSLVGPFTIENPAPVPDGGPQWMPEPLPQTRTNTGLAVTFESFRSFAPTGNPEATGPVDLKGRTEFGFAFRLRGEPVEHFRVQGIVLHDITGNRLAPHFNHLLPVGGNLVTGGQVVLAGALWPDEAAWRIEVDVLQTRELPDHAIWEAPPLPLDAGTLYLPLTNGFAIGDVELRLANLVPPGLVVSNDWQWIVRHWGNEANVYAVGVQFPTPMPDVRLLVLESRDDAGNEVKLIEHRGANETRQALFFQPVRGAGELRLKLAFPELRRFEFVAAPEHPKARP